MKTIFKTFSLLLAALSLPTACQSLKENTEAGSFTILVNASVPSTKTVFGEKNGTSYPTLWTANMKASFSLNAEKPVNVVPVPSPDGSGATMTASFSVESPSSGVLFGMSPGGYYNSKTKESSPGFSGFPSKKTESYAWMVFPSEQIPLANSCDECAQMLFADYAYSGGVPTEVDMHFRHVSAYGKMELANFAGGDVESVNLTFPKPVAGKSVKYFYEDSGANASGSLSGADVKTLSLSGENVENNVFWFGVVPTGELNSGNMVLEALGSDGETYTKTVSLSAEKGISFVSGRLSAFSVDMSDATTGGSGTGGGSGGGSASSGQATYKVTAKTAVTSSGEIPAGSTAQYEQTYGTVYQLIGGNSATLSLSGYEGATITGITLSMHANNDRGSGSFSAKVGSSSIASLTASSFNKWYDNSSYGKAWRDVHVTLTDAAREVAAGEKVILTIAATANSLYIESFTIDYTMGSGGSGSGGGGGTDTGNTIVTTGAATSATTSTATLSASYSGAVTAPREAGFEYGLTSVLGSEAMYQSTLTDVSGSFSLELDGLTEGAKYYYRAYVIVEEDGQFVYHYGGIKSFYVKSDDTDTPPPSTSAGGWYELPVMNVQKSGNYLQNASNTSEYYAYHMCTGGEKGPGGKTARNYTVCYSGQHHCPLWVAAPRHSMYVGGANRSDNYRQDGMIPSNIQYNSKSTGGGCNKGHMLGSAERTSSTNTNKDVFYYTNIAPQLSTGFNTGGGGWNNLEDWVDKQVCADTLYEVVGCYFEPFTDGYGYKVTPQTISYGGRNDVTRPTMFYYALIRTKKGNTGKALKDCSSSEIMCAAFVRSHTNSLKGQKPTSSEMMSIADLEKITGVTYFTNVPNAPKNSFSPSDWGL